MTVALSHPAVKQGGWLAVFRAGLGRFSFVVLLLIFAKVSLVPAVAAELTWQNFDFLAEGDRSYAEAALSEMWGEDPKLWPDWLEPAVVRSGAGIGRNILIVRQPYRQPCGEFGFIVLGPVDAAGERHPLGEMFCGGELGVVPGGFGRSMPDLIIGQHYERDADEIWQQQPPTRWRWSGDAWLRLIDR